jgi:hypothetical protein
MAFLKSTQRALSQIENSSTLGLLFSRYLFFKELQLITGLFQGNQSFRKQNPFQFALFTKRALVGRGALEFSREVGLW